MTKSKSRIGFPELTLSVWYCVPGRGLGCRDTRKTLPQFLHYHWEYQPKTIFLKREKMSRYLLKIIISIMIILSMKGIDRNLRWKVNRHMRETF